MGSYTMSGLSIAEQPRLDASHTSGRFAGQGVIVTGGAGGIGGMIVHRFLSDGAKVAIIDLDPERGAKKMEELRQEGLAENAKFYKLDVSVRADCFKVVSQIAADLGGLHHLVNCVAYFGSESLGATEEDCSVVNLSSISAHQTQPNRWTYAASKGAVNILTKNMALDLAKYRIRVNSVSPGWIWSPEVAKAAANGGRGHWEPTWGKFHISCRLGEMAEVAGAVTFLASCDAAFVNATDLKVDGGYGAMSAEGHGESSGSWAGSNQ